MMVLPILFRIFNRLTSQYIPIADITNLDLNEIEGLGEELYTKVVDKKLYIIEQWIGIYDKHNQKIYVNDMIKTKYDDMLYRVVYDRESCSFCLVDKTYNSRLYCLTDSDNICEDFEIVGNFNQIN